MSPTKDGQKAVQIKATNQATIDKFAALKPENISNPEFLLELLECYEKFTGKNCETEDKNYFPNLLGVGDDEKERAKNKKDKEIALRELFDLQPNDPLLVSECLLLEKASEYSGKSIAQMSLEGRVLVAKNEIGRKIQYQLGKGKKGTGDAKIAQTFEFMKQSSQKMSLNRLTQLSGSNRQTVERWCERNNVTFE